MEFCFGCGDDNPQGLHLHFDESADGSVSARTVLGRLHSGEPGVVHGGIQAVVLDEVMGRAVQARVRDLVGARTAVTAAFHLRYRRPCRTDVPVRAEAWVDTVEWPSLHVGGRIIDEETAVLTEATARWRVVDAEPGPTGG